MAIILIIKTGNGEVTELPLLHKITMGRSSSSDFVIKDNKMSGSHCSFEITPRGQVMFTDLGSTNGSFYNNSKINQTVFKIHDTIRIGDTLINIEEKRLSANERMTIGLSTYKEKNEKTLPVMKESERKLIEKHEEQMEAKAEKASPKRRTVILDKSIKQKNQGPQNFTGVDSVLDQEASSGETKMLKLEHEYSPAKKKKP